MFLDKVKSLALTLDYTEGQALDYSIDQPKRSTFLFVFKLIFSLVANFGSILNYKTNREADHSLLIIISSGLKWVIHFSEVCYSYCSHNNRDKRICIMVVVWKTNTECQQYRTHNWKNKSKTHSLKSGIINAHFEGLLVFPFCPFKLNSNI